MKYFLVKSIILSLVVCSGAFALDKHSVKEAKGEGITVLENGKTKKLIILKDDKLNNISVNSANSSKQGIIVSFKDSSKVDLESFENKYNLSLKTKLLIGYYIFYNNSEYSDTEVIEQIISQEDNLDIVKPNWKMHNTIR